MKKIIKIPVDELVTMKIVHNKLVFSNGVKITEIGRASCRERV